MRRAYRWIADRWVLAVGLLVLAYMSAPVAVILLLSFNQPKSNKTTYLLDEDGVNWTLNNYQHICSGADDMCGSLVVSLKVGVIATLIATVLGALIAFALVRHRFRGRSATNVLIFLPMATPEIVMGSSLLTLFISAGVNPGFWTIVIAHVMFCISFVVVTVKARLAGLDPRLQEAAMDLYATPWATFRRVTLPLVMPGIVAAALLSFSLSFDDYIITNFNATTSSITFPMYVWGAAQRGTPVQINVIGTLMFVLALVAVISGQLLGRRRSGRT